GGYFGLAENLGAHARAAFGEIGRADSIVIDPHKHGLQPYGCGCVLFRDPTVGRLYKHDSPYTYFSSAELHLGEISLECSRPGATAAALWATQKLLSLVKGGDFARGLERGRAAAIKLHNYLRSDNRFITAFEPELDIIAFAPHATSISDISARSRTFFESAVKRNLHLALAQLPVKFFPSMPADVRRDEETVTVLRSVLMKPEHLDWVDRIWGIVVEVIEQDLHEQKGSGKSAV